MTKHIFDESFFMNDRDIPNRIYESLYPVIKSDKVAVEFKYDDKVISPHVKELKITVVDLKDAAELFKMDVSTYDNGTMYKTQIIRCFGMGEIPVCKVQNEYSAKPSDQEVMIPSKSPNLAAIYNAMLKVRVEWSCEFNEAFLIGFFKKRQK